MENVRARMSEVEEALLEEALSQSCGTFKALRTSRPPAVPLRHITSYMSMCYEFSQDLLRTAHAMMVFTDSTDMELYFVNAWKNEIYRCPRTPGENKQMVRYEIGPGTTLAAYVAHTKSYILADDLINDENYPLGLHKRESLAQRVMCIPITTPSNEVIAVLELARDIDLEPYSTTEFEACMNTCSWIGSTIELSHTNLGLRKKTALYDYFQSLLNAHLFEHIPFRQYISELLSYSAKVLNAQSSNFYIVSDSGFLQGEKENVNFDMYTSTDEFRHFKKTSFGYNITTVASEALRSHSPLNLGKEELFSNYNMDIYKPVVVTSSLAVSSKGYAASRGVSEMINKQDNVMFGEEDAQLCIDIQRYCDYALSCQKLNEEITKLEAFLKNRNETLALLLEPCSHDKILYEKLEIQRPSNLYSIDYIPTENCYLTFCKLIDMMFADIIKRWSWLLEDKRARFLLMVHKASIFSEFHDFRKIFCSVHFVAVIIKMCDGFFSEIEKELLMYSALCHEINAPVPNERDVNSELGPFPAISASDYSTSFYYTKLIFQTCQIFSDESETEKILAKMNKLMEACYHARVAGKDDKILVLLAKRVFNLEKQRHRHLLRICIMAVAGLAVNFKPFMFCLQYCIKKKLDIAGITKKISTESCEIFRNLDCMELAESQRNLLDTFIIPWTITLRAILPETTSLILRLVEERENWNEITKSNITKDFWIPMKIEPEDERNNEVIHFLESSSKGEVKRKRSSSSENFLQDVKPVANGKLQNKRIYVDNSTN